MIRDLVLQLLLGPVMPATMVTPAGNVGTERVGVDGAVSSESEGLNREEQRRRDETQQARERLERLERENLGTERQRERLRDELDRMERRDRRDDERRESRRERERIENDPGYRERQRRLQQTQQARERLERLEREGLGTERQRERLRDDLARMERRDRRDGAIRESMGLDSGDNRDDSPATPSPQRTEPNYDLTRDQAAQDFLVSISADNYYQLSESINTRSNELEQDFAALEQQRANLDRSDAAALDAFNARVNELNEAAAVLQGHDAALDLWDNSASNRDAVFEHQVSTADRSGFADQYEFIDPASGSPSVEDEGSINAYRFDLTRAGRVLNARVAALQARIDAFNALPDDQKDHAVGRQLNQEAAQLTAEANFQERALASLDQSAGNIPDESNPYTAHGEAIRRFNLANPDRQITATGLFGQDATPDGDQRTIYTPEFAAQFGEIVGAPVSGDPVRDKERLEAALEHHDLTQDIALAESRDDRRDLQAERALEVAEGARDVRLANELAQEISFAEYRDDVKDLQAERALEVATAATRARELREDVLEGLAGRAEDQRADLQERIELDTAPDTAPDPIGFPSAQPQPVTPEDQPVYYGGTGGEQAAGAVLARDRSGQLQVFDPSEPFRPEAFDSALQDARTRGDQVTLEKLVAYQEAATGERFLGRSAATDPHFEATSAQKNLPLYYFGGSAAAGTIASIGPVTGTIGGVISSGFSAVAPTGDKPVPFTWGLLRTGDERPFQLTREDLGRLPGAFAEGYALGGLTQRAYTPIRAAASRLPLVGGPAGGMYLPVAVRGAQNRFVQGAAAGAVVDTAYLSTPVGGTGYGLSPQDRAEIGLGVITSPVFDRAIEAAPTTARYAGRTLLPSKVDFDFRDYGEGPFVQDIDTGDGGTYTVTGAGPNRVSIPLTGGFVPAATSAPRVPHLLIPNTPEHAAISGQVFDEMARTGRSHGIIGASEVQYTPSRFAEAMTEANPDASLYYSATDVGHIIKTGPIAKAKPELGPSEQYFFVSPGDVNPGFMAGSAFGGASGAPPSPGIFAYNVETGNFQRVTMGEGDTGAVKYYKGGFEAERGIPSGEPIPPATRQTAAGIARGDLYTSEGVNVPHFGERLEANLKSLADIVTRDRTRGRFQMQRASPEALAELQTLTAEPAGAGAEAESGLTPTEMDAATAAAANAGERAFDQAIRQGEVTPAEKASFLQSVRTRFQQMVAQRLQGAQRPATAEAPEPEGSSGLSPAAREAIVNRLGQAQEQAAAAFDQAARQGAPPSEGRAAYIAQARQAEIDRIMREEALLDQTMAEQATAEADVATRRQRAREEIARFIRSQADEGIQFRAQDDRPGPVDAGRADAGRADVTRLGETRGEARGDDFRPGDPRLGGARGDDLRVDDLRPGEARGDDFRPDDPRLGDTRGDDLRVDDLRPGEARGDDFRPDDPRLGDTRGDDLRANVLRTGGLRADVARLGGARLEDFRTEDFRTEDFRTEDFRTEDFRTEDFRTEVPRVEVPHTETVRTTTETGRVPFDLTVNRPGRTDVDRRTPPPVPPEDPPTRKPPPEPPEDSFAGERQPQQDSDRFPRILRHEETVLDSEDPRTGQVTRLVTDVDQPSVIERDHDPADGRDHYAGSQIVRAEGHTVSRDLIHEVTDPNEAAELHPRGRVETAVFTTDVDRGIIEVERVREPMRPGETLEDTLQRAADEPVAPATPGQQAFDQAMDRAEAAADAGDTRAQAQAEKEAVAQRQAADAAARQAAYDALPLHEKLRQRAEQTRQGKQPQAATPTAEEQALADFRANKGEDSNSLAARIGRSLERSQSNKESQQDTTSKKTSAAGKGQQPAAKGNQGLLSTLTRALAASGGAQPSSPPKRKGASSGKKRGRPKKNSGKDNVVITIRYEEPAGREAAPASSRQRPFASSMFGGRR